MNVVRPLNRSLQRGECDVSCEVSRTSARDFALYFSVVFAAVVLDDFGQYDVAVLIPPRIRHREVELQIGQDRLYRCAVGIDFQPTNYNAR